MVLCSEHVRGGITQTGTAAGSAVPEGVLNQSVGAQCCGVLTVFDIRGRCHFQKRILFWRWRSTNIIILLIQIQVP